MKCAGSVWSSGNNCNLFSMEDIKQLPSEFEEDDDSTTDNNGFSVSENGDSLYIRIVENENESDEDTDGGLIDSAFGTSDVVRQDASHSLDNFGGDHDISNMQKLNNYIDNGSFNILFGNVNNYDSKYGYDYDSALSKNDVVLDDGGTKRNNIKTISRVVSLVGIITVVDIQININVASITIQKTNKILGDGDNTCQKYNFCFFFVCFNIMLFLL